MILDTALQLFRQNPYEEIFTTICPRSGVANGLLFYYSATNAALYGGVQRQVEVSWICGVVRTRGRDHIRAHPQRGLRTL